MSGWRLYCGDCGRRTAHTEYGSGGTLATCNACESIRHLPIDDDLDDEDQGQSDLTRWSE